MINILKRSLPKRIVARLSRHPIALVSITSLSFKLGQDGWNFKKGKIDGIEVRRRAGQHLGNMGGGLAGAAAGAAAGAVLIPGVGFILGGFAGGMLGEDLGGKVGLKAVLKAEELVGAEIPADRPVPPAPKKHL